MHFIRAFVGLALAAAATAAPTFHIWATGEDLPEGCPKSCDCSQYTDFSQ